MSRPLTREAPRPARPVKGGRTARYRVNAKPALAARDLDRAYVRALAREP